MGTETKDAAGAKDAAGTEEVTGAEEVTGTEEPAPAKASKVDVTKDAEGTGDGTDAAADAELTDEEDDDIEAADASAAGPVTSAGVGQGAGAVVSVALGVIGLSGGWLGTVAAARENLYGQMETSQTAGAAKTIEALYGDSWKATALIAGVFALAALIAGFVVLVRPAFGAPGQEQAPWIKSVAWAGVVLGVIGLILAVAKYSDLLLSLPSAPS
ncbi:hypothetical protein DMA15_26450 [Streptomyces sp. WAC 01529]|uniref:hypothetical protein n=1 Tax=Streptomyces sp. WAC 01529 TaxID=2203205 RepID=UPI000F6E2954|nr:hypothetical protein [Streptomyces sp. WAC 01529]AZM55688.1 hypothetical protein DMA15_26450 [Streptomyces sp. WAC 01529]